MHRHWKSRSIVQKRGGKSARTLCVHCQNFSFTHCSLAQFHPLWKAPSRSYTLLFFFTYFALDFTSFLLFHIFAIKLDSLESFAYLLFIFWQQSFVMSLMDTWNSLSAILLFPHAVKHITKRQFYKLFFYFFLFNFTCFKLEMAGDFSASF